jgi:RNAse (barnase) inhibitor barstar
MNLSTLFSELSLTGGFSYNVTTGESNPTTGYMVSLRDCERQFYFDDFENKDIKNYFARYVNSLSDETAFLGGWVHDNRVYLDVSINIPNLEDAIYYGMHNDQDAIWDCANNKEIILPLPQKSGTMTQNKTYNEMKARQLAHLIQTASLE